ncbi:MAG: hypothetical protein JF597_19585 [Streptomyces sp.]|uniref:hypothetical protein n=1 Tax=Streptomyces sp. TaxID=1931 RepID=UPI0025EB8096|nr:hypothetical protein [Streptomyces sp.]MBW8795707.1 hypothetical protein [Streptomyces sp.]
MTRPSRPARVLATALAAGTLLATAACSDGSGSPEAAAVSLAAERSPTPSRTPALTGPGAQAALITPADIEDDWQLANDAATWRNQMLVGKVDVAEFLGAKSDAADCQRLLDGLYSDTLLGRATGASGLRGFTSEDSRLLYQVGDYGQATMEATIKWLKNLPTECNQFSATASDGSKRTVQVVEYKEPPKVGDELAALTVTVQGTSNGQPATTTLDVAALRVGASGAAVTNGGLSGVDHDSTALALQNGAARLKDVLSGKTPAPLPSQFD